MHPDQLDLANVDLMDQNLHADGMPHQLFTRLRSEMPVHGGTNKDGERYWSVSRDTDVALVNRDPATFSSYRNGVFLHRDEIIPLELLQNIVLCKDPPDHSKFRRIVSSAFTPKALRPVEQSIHGIVRETIDRVAPQGRCDFVRDIAVPVPLGVLGSLLGVPHADIGLLHDWTETIESAQRAPRTGKATQTFVDMSAYLHELIRKQSADDDGSLVARLRAARIDGDQLTDDEILVFFALLVFAGNDTTRNTASLGMLTLLEHPDQWELLRSDPSRIPGAVEEILRFTSVIKYFVRTATCDTVIGEQPIAAGDKVVTWFTSASHDDERFPDASRFDITRDGPTHRAFGAGGPHFCLGQSLARSELRILFAEIIERMPDISCDGPVEYLRSNWANALSAMPVRFTPSDPAARV